MFEGRRGPPDIGEIPLGVPCMIQAWKKPSRSIEYTHSRSRSCLRIMFPLYHFPELPSSKSLLIKGEYHPSAPIHFCISHLSHANDESVAVFITPSKESFVQTLVAYNDRWLGKYGGSGEVAAKLSRVKVLFVVQLLQTMYAWVT